MICKRRFFAWVLCFAILPLVTLAGKKPDEHCTYDKLTRQVVTEHIFWANPYYRGVTRVLVIAPEFCQRETVELAQRLEIEYTAAMTGGNIHTGPLNNLGSKGKPWSLDVVPEQYVKQKLVEKLAADYDVIVIGKIFWNVFPRETQYAILRKVCDGTGLVYINPAGEDEILKRVFKDMAVPERTHPVLAGVPLERLPVLQDLDLKRVAGVTRFGKGRIVVLRYSPKEEEQHSVGGYPGRYVSYHALTPAGSGLQYWQYDKPWSYFDTPVLYDYYQSLVAKAVLYAAGKDSDTQIESIQATGGAGSIPRADLSRHQMEIKLNRSGTDAVKAEACLVIRDLYNCVEHESKRSVSVQPGRSSLLFALPTLKGGMHFCDVFLDDGKGRRITWGSGFMDVQAPLVIKELNLPAGMLRNGDTVAGTVDITGAGQGVCRVLASDTQGRLLNTMTMPVDGPGALPFRLGLNGVLGPLVRVEAQLEDGAGVIDSVRRELPFRLDYPDEAAHPDVQVMIGEAPDEGHIFNLACKQFRGLGIDGFYVGTYFLTPASAARVAKGMAYNNLRPLCFIDYLSGRGLGPDAEWKKHLQRERDIAAAWAGYHPVYNLGDDCNLNYGGDMCWCDVCTADFREWLKGQYGSLEALNREWDTSLTDWKEIGRDLVCQRQERGNRAPWIDHRTHMDKVFTQIHADVRTALRETDPGAKVGIGSFMEGGRDALTYVGADYRRMMNAMEYMGSYPDNSWFYFEMLRSWARPEHLLSSFYGKYPLVLHGEEEGRSEHFQRAFPWYELLHRGNYYTLFAGMVAGGMAADLTIMPWLKWTTEELRQIKAGIGQLVLAAERQQDGIAILFAQKNIHTSCLPDRKGPHILSAAEGFYLGLQDLGFQYDVLADDQVEKGSLAAGRYRLLLLPCARAMSTGEVAAVRSFIEKGGFVVADVLPAVMDEHGKSLPQSALAGCFGETGKPFSCGQGMTIFGIEPNRYKDIREEADGREFRHRLRGILDSFGLKNPVAIQCEGDADYPYRIETVRYRLGNSSLFGFIYDWWAPAPERPVSVSLDGKGFLYDLNEGKFIGVAPQFEYRVSPFVPKFVALLPGKITRVTAEADQRTYCQGEVLKFTVRVEVSGEMPSGLVARVTLKNPQDTEVKYYTRNVYLENGVGQVVMPLAYDELPGTWNIAVREICSGLIGAAKFKVKSQDRR